MAYKKKLNNKLLTKSKKRILDGDEVEQTVSGTTPIVDTYVSGTDDQSNTNMTAADKKRASYEADKATILNNKKYNKKQQKEKLAELNYEYSKYDYSKLYSTPTYDLLKELYPVNYTHATPGVFKRSPTEDIMPFTKEDKNTDVIKARNWLYSWFEDPTTQSILKEHTKDNTYSFKEATDTLNEYGRHKFMFHEIPDDEKIMTLVTRALTYPANSTRISNKEGDSYVLNTWLGGRAATSGDLEHSNGLIFNRNSTYDPAQVYLHEYTHLISDLLGYKNNNKGKYEDRISELYSGLMELRRDRNLSPKKRDYTEEDAQRIIDFYKMDPKDVENRSPGLYNLLFKSQGTGISASALANMLNTWAAAPTKDEQYEALGFTKNPITGEYESQYKNGGKLNMKVKNKKSYGGELKHTGDFSNGVVFIDEGGTHEQNPFEGVLMGYDNEGTPNLVEQGEIIYNDYVFSNRLKANKKGLENIGFSDKYKDWTFAAIAEDLQKESAERPNDILSKQTLDDMMSRLVSVQEEVRMKKKQKEQNKFNLGGKVNKFDEADGTLSTGNDSNIPPAILQMLSILPSVSIPSFDGSDYSVTDPLGRNIDFVARAENENRGYEIKNEVKHSEPFHTKYSTTQNDDFHKGVAAQKIAEEPQLDPENKNFDWTKFGNDLLRMGAPIANGIASLAQNLKKPDYSENERALNEARTAPTSNIVAPTEDISIRPVDTNYMANMLRNQGNTAISNINNTAINAQQAMANQMLANNQTQAGIANAFLQANDVNLNRMMQENEFNRGNDQFGVQTAFQNFANNAARHNTIVNATAQAAAANSALDAARAQGSQASRDVLTESLAGIGSENHWSSIIKDAPWLLYDSQGKYKNPTQTNVEAYGGRILSGDSPEQTLSNEPVNTYLSMQEAADYNRNNTDSYMHPYMQDGEETFLYPEELQASSVKAFDSDKDYKAYRDKIETDKFIDHINKRGDVAQFIFDYGISNIPFVQPINSAIKIGKDLYDGNFNLEDNWSDIITAMPYVGTFGKVAKGAQKALAYADDVIDVAKTANDVYGYTNQLKDISSNVFNKGGKLLTKSKKRRK